MPDGDALLECRKSGGSVFKDSEIQNLKILELLNF